MTRTQATVKTVTSDDLPGLYQAASQASLVAQGTHFACLAAYLACLVLITVISYLLPTSSQGAFISIIVFLLALATLIVLRVYRYDDTWYNGRAVAESVKTRAWRWMMRAEPYGHSTEMDVASKELIADLKTILTQNRRLSSALSASARRADPISQTMIKVRAMPTKDRLDVYMFDRVADQAKWYHGKGLFNKKKARLWFWVSVTLNLTAVVMLLFRVRNPSLLMPIPTVATAAGSVLTWLEAKKHNELASSYSLAAHEIDLIGGEALCVGTDENLSAFVIDAEAAFSREHTQWAARRSEQSCIITKEPTGRV
ncbi:MAG: DUF4231 domain-containing protein [Syntrophorhabdales bacterium]